MNIYFQATVVMVGIGICLAVIMIATWKAFER